MLIGGLEAGGTKMVVAVGNENGEILERATFPTLTPAETMPPMIEFFKKHKIEKLGIASFGPIDYKHGCVADTPKPGWKDYPVKAAFEDALGVKSGFDTDVNAAALAEYILGAGKGKGSLLYVTIGTGIGGGFVSEGNMLHGLQHPEMGHMNLQSVEGDPMPDGACPYHKHCLEGLAAGPSLLKRWGKPGYELPVDHAAWDIEAEYLAQMCQNAIMVLSPEVIVLGGGVMQQKQLISKVRAKTLEKVNGYIRSSALTPEGISSYIVEPGLGVNSGITGALMLGIKA